MVKNLKGGSKAKRQGRKFTSSSTSRSALRLSDNDLEIYACVIKHYGAGRCLVKTVHDNEMLCIIRHKFKKRNSNVLVGSIILVGLREWEGPDNYKTCDLLELYDQEDHNLLKSIPSTNIINLDKFILSTFDDNTDGLHGLDIFTDQEHSTLDTTHYTDHTDHTDHTDIDIHDI
jgi:translation initiation factor IF-1